MSITDFLAKVGVDEKLRTKVDNLLKSGKSPEELMKEYDLDCKPEELMEALKGLKEGKIPTDLIGKATNAFNKFMNS